jgi:hypothetical protein
MEKFWYGLAVGVALAVWMMVLVPWPVIERSGLEVRRGKGEWVEVWRGGQLLAEYQPSHGAVWSELDGLLKVKAGGEY